MKKTSVWLVAAATVFVLGAVPSAQAGEFARMPA